MGCPHHGQFGCSLMKWIVLETLCRFTMYLAKIGNFDTASAGGNAARWSIWRQEQFILIFRRAATGYSLGLCSVKAHGITAIRRLDQLRLAELGRHWLSTRPETRAFFASGDRSVSERHGIHVSIRYRFCTSLILCSHASTAAARSPSCS
jgi:hypothetical protein